MMSEAERPSARMPFGLPGPSSVWRLPARFALRQETAILLRDYIGPALYRLAGPFVGGGLLLADTQMQAEPEHEKTHAASPAARG
jgi:hypothetical protein